MFRSLASFGAVALTVVLCTGLEGTLDAARGSKPHIVYFLGDDVGWYNLGFRGNEEARTPNLDALAKEGVILERMYTYKFCSPTRSAFISGRLPIHVNEANRNPQDVGGVDLRMTLMSEKLKAAGYATHQIGKWNVGSRAYGQLPTQRGFDSSFGYMGGGEDHYTQMGGYGAVDFAGTVVDLWENDGPAYGQNGTYNAFHFAERAVKLIEAHDASQPFFLFLAWQNAHTPNQVPAEFLGPKLPDDTDEELRRTYQGMVHCLDNGIGNVTQALKSKGMWDNSLVIFSSDNGGREDHDFGGNNYPLRGMKFSDFEGGVRVASVASGGLIPAARRGSTESGLIHICDWYATFCSLAGVNPTDEKAAAGKVPPIDSLDVWSTVSAGAASPRKVIGLSSTAIMIWPHKLITGTERGMGMWTGPRHPNTTVLTDADHSCDEHCIFDVEADPNEHKDLAPSSPKLLKKLLEALEVQKSTVFQTNEIQGYDNCISLEEYAKRHRGFGGPLCYNGSVPGAPPALSLEDLIVV
mmetsp:Transcript_36903/g.80960  ORF Transcript_36903/g.80960 Transcript_36903/m.80960 type:complete len:523 (-) Transcript_36903:110-1678(-)|eukprot:CAMPEP_0170591862 /NCGR_PEP_ID=MMETSP0224-20130122/12628_1 /TAXON_ID=285029 /ORGANISM="Togula jolla, Strain CCCM 725" /LENGTH=522 /DNA_ID=CAMNT_0010915751 /DNA_START=68 /DNA_END=1636 /DNA_ORIENTATION=-